MTKIRIDTRGPRREISRDLWGIFFEDINYAADGGLYAELVQNRSFSYSEADAAGWSALTAWTTTGAVEIRDDSPLSPSAPTYVRLGSPKVASSIVNGGFGGIVVRAGERYRFSVFARADRIVPLDVTLRSAEGSSTEHVTLEPSGWRRHEAILSPHFASMSAELVLSIPAGAAADVDFVSLFPVDVYGGSDNGMRIDLAEAIAALKPRFIRFPGGCISHGLGLENMYRRPTTIGPVHERRQDRNLWGYHQSMGLGYLEYFRFCEQLGATPLPVLAAGVCCQNTIGGPQAIPVENFDAYVREILDLIEFANGAADTRWGAIRASLGHPEPFGLRYLGIGNEDQIDDTFRDRFTRIFTAVHAAHPEVEVVGTAGPAPLGSDYELGWALARELNVPIVDEHSYKAPSWLFQNVDRYDRYNRSEASVYVGEYGSRGNTFLNALAEAAYMTGLERNGDIVRLASYAPLLAKIDHAQWVPDLIYFDNTRVLPSLTYYIQQMFADTAGTAVIPVEVDEAPVFVRSTSPDVGLALSAEGFDVKCELIALNGARAADITVASGGAVHVVPVQAYGGDAVIELRFTATGGDPDRGNFAVHFGAVYTPDGWEWNFGTWLNRTITLLRSTDGFRDEQTGGVPFTVELGRTYDVKIEVHDAGRQLRLWVDGELVQEFEDPAMPEQRFVATCIYDDRSDRAHLRIVNATGAEVELDIVDALGGRVNTGRVRQIAGAPTAGRPFETAPFVPKFLGERDRVVAPGYSFSVIEIHT